MAVEFVKSNQFMMRDGVGGDIKATAKIGGHQSPTEKFISPVLTGISYGIFGITKDSAGNRIGNCIVHLFYTNSDVLVNQITSDAFGNYLFLVGPVYPCYVVAYKVGTPDVFGTTVNTLIAKQVVTPLLTLPYIQTGNFNSSGTSANNTVSFPANPSGGNLLVLVVNGGNTFNIPSGWTKDVTLVNNTETTIFHKISDGSEKNIATTMTGAGLCNLVCFEFGLYTTFDKSSTGTATTGATTINCGTTPVTTGANEMVMAVIGISGTPPLTSFPFGWSNGFTQYSYGVDSSGALEIGVAFYFPFPTSTGTFNTIATLSRAIPASVTDNGMIATFK